MCHWGPLPRLCICVKNNWWPHVTHRIQLVQLSSWISSNLKWRPRRVVMLAVSHTRHRMRKSWHDIQVVPPSCACVCVCVRQWLTVWSLSHRSSIWCRGLRYYAERKPLPIADLLIDYRGSSPNPEHQNGSNLSPSILPMWHTKHNQTTISCV